MKKREMSHVGGGKGPKSCHVLFEWPLKSNQVKHSLAACLRPLLYPHPHAWLNILNNLSYTNIDVIYGRPPLTCKILVSLDSLYGIWPGFSVDKH